MEQLCNACFPVGQVLQAQLRFHLQLAVGVTSQTSALRIGFMIELIWGKIGEKHDSKPA